MRALSAVVGLMMVALTGCWSDGLRLSPVEKAEFGERLRTGVDQIRNDLPASARAEFEACARLDPQSSDLMFQMARLRLLEGDHEAENQAVAELRELIERDSDNVKAHRLLFEIETGRRNREEAQHHETEIERIYGAVGTFEMHCFKRLMRDGSRAALTEAELEATGDSEVDSMLRNLRVLRLGGPGSLRDAAHHIEGFLKRFPHLAGIRFFFVKILMGGPIRMDTVSMPELAPLSSAPRLEASQKHDEDIFDQIHPRGRPAQYLMRSMSRNHISMGEYAEAVALTDILLNWPGLPSVVRPGLFGQKAIAHFKLDQIEECARALESSLAENANAERLEHTWILRIARERLGASTEELDSIFRLRPDLNEAETELWFEDIAPQLGIDRLDGYGPNAWGDYDRDGDFDLFVSGGDSFSSLFKNAGDHFEDVTQVVGLGSTNSGFSSTFVDIDNDGWLDLYIGRNGWNGPAPNALFRNLGGESFENATESSGGHDLGDSFVHAWSDVDRDGDLDLYICNGITLTGATNRLLRNNGDGTFTDITIEAGLNEPSGTQTIGAAFGDYDKDGWPDLFVSGCYTYNRLYHNLGNGVFEEVATVAGVDGVSHFSAGYVCFFADFNNDTWPDILRTSLAPWRDVLSSLSSEYDGLTPAQKRRLADHSPRLYLNNQDGTFVDTTIEAGLGHPSGTMGANVSDIDNDGWLDIYFGTGSPLLSRLEPDRFYRANGDGTFSDVTFVTGLGNLGKGHGVTTCDFDGDGDLEIYAAEGGMVHGDLWNNAFYVNQHANQNHWFHVDLEGVDSNRDGLDSQLTVTTGSRTFYREAHNGEGFGSTNSPTIEFGLGDEDRVDCLEIRWPSGTVQLFENLEVDQRIFVREGQVWQQWQPQRIRGE